VWRNGTQFCKTDSNILDFTKCVDNKLKGLGYNLGQLQLGTLCGKSTSGGTTSRLGLVGGLVMALAVLASLQ
jgi:hypothetical protein